MVQITPEEVMAQRASEAELARRLGVLPSNVTHTLKPTLIN